MDVQNLAPLLRPTSIRKNKASNDFKLKGDGNEVICHLDIRLFHIIMYEGRS